MNFRQLTVVMAMSAVVATSAAHAASSAEYLAVREKTSVTTLQTTNELMHQYASHAGQVIELDGVVSDIIPYGKQKAFLLRIDSQQNLMVTEPQDDADIVTGAALRVLVRIPANGEVLEGLSAIKAEQSAPAQASPPTTEIAQAPSPAKSAVDISPATPDAASLAKTELGGKASPLTQTTEMGATTDAKAVMVDEVRQEYTAPTHHRVAASHRRHTSRRAARSTRNAVRVAAKPTHTFSQKVQLYAQKIRGFNPGVSPAVATSIATHVLLKSQKYGVDPRLVFALIAKESHFNPNAVSPVGARGLGQLMPGTAAAAGIHAPFDVAQNIEGTVRYLAKQLTNFGGNVAQALAAYNAGPGSVIRYGGVPPFSETVNYVRVISTHYEALKIGLL